MNKLALVLVCLCAAPCVAAYGEENAAEQDRTPGRQIDASGPLTYVIPIHGEINRSMLAFVLRSVEEAKDADAKVVVFDIDTFGGGVDPALQITTVIASAEPAVTVAYVTSGPASKGVSWSAGAIIAISCRKIFMAPGTSMGAAAPVFASPDGQMVMAPEKVVSALRAQAQALAEKNGYPPAIARAMVDMKVELSEVYIDGDLQVVSAADMRSVEREAREQGKTVEYGKTIVTSDQLLTLTANEMEKYGVSSGTVGTLDDMLALLDLENPRVVTVEKTAADGLVGLLTNPSMVALLIIVGLIALYTEVTTPGFGVPGTLAIICFAVIFSSNYLLGRVGSIELLMFLAGLILLILEILVIPGFGAAGLSGIVLIVLSLVLSLQGFTLPKFALEWDIFLNNLMLVTFSLVAALACIAVVAHFMPQMPVLNRLTLATTQAPAAGYTVQEPESAGEMVGKRGVTVTKLRPAGKGKIDGRLVQVETDGEFFDVGVPIEVVEASGNRIVVRKV